MFLYFLEHVQEVRRSAHGAAVVLVSGESMESAFSNQHEVSPSEEELRAAQVFEIDDRHEPHITVLRLAVDQGRKASRPTSARVEMLVR